MMASNKNNHNNNNKNCNEVSNHQLFLLGKHVAANPDLFSSRPKTAKVTHPNPTPPPAPALAHAPAPT